MSETTNKAVFLSYASQDAEAARRICESLRSGGVEVWFDADGGLEHGDEWDAKIRRQIKECALFIPVISANTQAREEGYFRIEWELAAQRALGIASGVAFILPVVIDDAKEPDALVPDRFRTVQWTKLPGGNVPPDVLQRFLKLWSHRAVVVAHRKEQASAPRMTEAAPVAAAGPGRSRWLAVAATLLLGAALAGAYFWLRPQGGAVPRVQPTALRPGPGTPAAARDWPRDPELKRAYQLSIELNNIREDLLLAEEMAKKAVEKSPADPEAVTVLAHIESTILLRNFDFTADRTALARRYSERAVQLAPDNPVALTALAMFLITRGGDLPRAEELLRQVVTLDAAEPRYARHLALVVGRQNGAEGVAASLRLFEEIVARFPRDPLAHYDLSIRYRDSGNYPEAERELDAVIALAPVANAFDWKARLALMRGDLPGVKAQLERVPARLQAEERAVLTRVAYALFSGDVTYGLQALNRYAEPWFYDNSNYSGPRSLLVGALREREGNLELARTHYEAALTEIRRYRDAHPSDPGTQGAEAWVLLGLGRPEEARAAHRISVAGGARPFRFFPPGLWWFSVYPRILLLEDRAKALAIVREVAEQARVREPLLLRLRMDPRLAAFHQDPEIVALLTAPSPDAAEPAKADNKSVAVLAFANLSDDKANEYFSDGISEELLNVLAKVPGLKVSARTSAFYFKGKEVPVPEIAKQLGVAYVVEGSVRKQGDKVRITAQLIKAADGFHVWSDTFTRDLKDIFAVQDEIAGLIAKNLSLRLGTDRPTSGRATVPEAFELYVQGRAAWNLRTREGYTQAENLLKRAIDLDPGFARAHSALADVWSIAGYENESGGGTFGWRNSLTLAKIAAKAEQAVALDANCAESLTSLASALEFGWKWGEAERAYRRAIELNPNYATARHWFGMMLWVQGKIDEALRQLKRATENDPLSHRILDTYARMLNLAGRPEEALAVAERALALQPLAIQAATQKARALVLLGRSNEAVALLEKALTPSANTDQRTEALLTLHLAGADAPMRRLIGATEELPASQFRFASLIALGRTDEALAELRPENLHEFQLINMAVMSFYDPVREDPRFLQAISEVGYLEYYRRARAWLAANVVKEKK